MHIEFLVEEASTEAALQLLLPRMLNTDITFALHPFQGKTNLLGNLGVARQGMHKLGVGRPKESLHY